jgi:dihydrofolate synthase/folylpolyglutamate synthase
VNFEEAFTWLFGFTDYEFTPLSEASATALQLGRLRLLLERLGEPQLGQKTVHITGSKGKGSTASMIAALLSGAGLKTGLYTSPHLDSICERIAIGGEPIAEDEFADLASVLRPAAERTNQTSGDSALTTFELLTALAFLAFKTHGCDWQVIEVGMGGRLDATNVLDRKELCVFTPISLEHTAILGSTTAEIATDKSGILRRGARAVLAPQDPSAGAVLRRACEGLDVPYELIDQMCAWTAERSGLDGQHCVVQTPRQTYRFFLPLLGAHQVENAAAALMGIESLRDTGVDMQPEQAATALESIRWPGRLEVVRREPVVIVDGAHNAASAARLAETLRDLSEGRDPGIELVIGTLADKDLVGIVRALAPAASRVYAVEPNHPRARAAAEIASAFAAAGVSVEECGPVPAGLQRAFQEADRGGLICVAGSLYAVAEARAALHADFAAGVQQDIAGRPQGA